MYQGWGQVHSGVARGAAAPEWGAIILPKNFFNLYTEKFLKILKNTMKM